MLWPSRRKSRGAESSLWWRDKYDACVRAHSLPSAGSKPLLGRRRSQTKKRRVGARGRRCRAQYGAISTADATVSGDPGQRAAICGARGSPPWACDRPLSGRRQCRDDRRHAGRKLGDRVPSPDRLLALDPPASMATADENRQGWSGHGRVKTERRRAPAAAHLDHQRDPCRRTPGPRARSCARRPLMMVAIRIPYRRPEYERRADGVGHAPELHRPRSIRLDEVDRQDQATTPIIRTDFCWWRGVAPTI